MKRTWQPKRIPRLREHGFMKRMSTRNGRRVLESSPRQRALEANGLVQLWHLIVRYVCAKNSDFQRVRQQGRSITSRLLILAWIPNEVARLRIGFVVSKRISKLAVERNYIKRLLSEAVRHTLPDLPSGWDIVLSARNQVITADLHVLEQDIVTLLHRARLLDPRKHKRALSC